MPSKKETQLQERIERMYVMSEKLRGVINEQKTEIKTLKTEIKTLNINIKRLFKIAEDGVAVGKILKKNITTQLNTLNKSIGRKIPKLLKTIH